MAGHPWGGCATAQYRRNPARCHFTRCSRLDEDQRIAPVDPAVREQHPKSPVCVGQPWPLHRSFEDAELMAQRQDLHGELPARSEEENDAWRREPTTFSTVRDRGSALDRSQRFRAGRSIWEGQESWDGTRPGPAVLPGFPSREQPAAARPASGRSTVRSPLDLLTLPGGRLPQMSGRTPGLAFRC